jgi:hypothetical protein
MGKAVSCMKNLSKIEIRSDCCRNETSNSFNYCQHCGSKYRLPIDELSNKIRIDPEDCKTFQKVKQNIEGRGDREEAALYEARAQQQPKKEIQSVPDRRSFNTIH